MTLKYSQMHFKMFKSRASLTLGSFRFKNGTRFSKTDIFKYFLLFLVRKANFRPKILISGQFVHFQSKKLFFGQKCSFLNNSFIFSQKSSFSAKNARFWTICSFLVKKLIFGQKCSFLDNSFIFSLKNLYLCDINYVPKCFFFIFDWKTYFVDEKNRHFDKKKTQFFT